jgi:glutathione-specific gamma-glutamylcyclotransferase
MWVFGYGSLIWDGWEKAFECDCRSLAELARFRRAFSKLSVRNWGTRERPCPTLNLVRDESANCRGIAFHFPAHQGARVLAELRRREGANFELSPMSVRLADGRNVTATVPLYTGPNTIDDWSLEDIAKLIGEAEGRDGRCIDYVSTLAQRLISEQIDDPCVSALARALHLGARRKEDAN